MGRDAKFNPRSSEFTGQRDSRLLDAFGRPLGPGDRVVIAVDQLTVWTIRDIRASLDPRLPLNTALVTLAAVHTLPGQLGMPSPLLLVAQAPQTEDEAEPEKPTNLVVP